MESGKTKTLRQCLANFAHKAPGMRDKAGWRGGGRIRNRAPLRSYGDSSPAHAQPHARPGLCGKNTHALITSIGQMIKGEG